MEVSNRNSNLILYRRIVNMKSDIVFLRLNYICGNNILGF